MSWKNRYKEIFETDAENIIITAVGDFPNWNKTIDDVNKYYEIEKIESDALFKEMYAFFQLNNGRNFIPIGFEDRFPDLQKYKDSHDLSGSHVTMRWCYGYSSPYFNREKSSITYPTSNVIKQWLEYCNKNRIDYMSKFYFNLLVKQIIYERTEGFDESKRSRRFYVIENKSLAVGEHDGINDVEYWYNYLKTENIYEIMFNMFK
jgi:hypothetical protein